MVRGRVQMKRIENPVHRQVTFCKRRAGLLKKAKELSVLCDADIGLFVFSPHGKLYELATKGTMQELIQRYIKFAGQDQPDQATQRQTPNNAKEKIDKLKQEIDVLKKGLRYNFEEGSPTMRFEELEELEKRLEIWICNIRSTKMEVMFQEIQSLRKEEGELRAANKYLQDTIEGNTELTNIEPEREDENVIGKIKLLHYQSKLDVNSFIKAAEFGIIAPNQSLLLKPHSQPFFINQFH